MCHLPGGAVAQVSKSASEVHMVKIRTSKQPYPGISSSGPDRIVAPFSLAILMDSKMRSRLPWKSRGTLGNVATATVMRADILICIYENDAEDELRCG